MCISVLTEFAYAACGSAVEMQYGPNETTGRTASGGQQDAPDCVSDAKPE